MFVLFRIHSWLVCLSVLCLASSAYASELQFIGKAYSLDNDELLYTESHKISLGPQGAYQKSTVQYKDPNGVLIAYKTLNFQTDFLQPELRFADERDGASIQVQNHKDYLDFLTKEREEYKLKKVDISKKKTSIVDAGFDRFVVENWDALVTGKKLPFEFFALTRGEYITFNIKRRALSDEYLDLEITPNNWLIKVLMKPIQLRYDRSSRLLKEFKGVTNIRAMTDQGLSDDNYRARIQYEYPSAASKSGV